MTLSNQYPRLPWRHNPDPVRGGYMAEPHGPDAGLARVYYAAHHPAATQWVWAVFWRDRFASDGGFPDSKAAAEAATIAYWDHMEVTEGWTPAPPPPAQYVDLVASHFWRRVDHWVRHRATEADIQREMGRFMKAAVSGPPIIGSPEDRMMWMRLTEGLHDLRFPPQRY